MKPNTKRPVHESAGPKPLRTNWAARAAASEHANNVFYLQAKQEQEATEIDNLFADTLRELGSEVVSITELVPPRKSKPAAPAPAAPVSRNGRKAARRKANRIIRRFAASL